MDANTIRCMTHDLCLLLSENDLIMYTNFEFCEEKYQSLINL